MAADVVDVLIYLVGQNDNAGILGQHVGKGLQLFAAVHTAGGVGGRAEDNGLGLGGDGGFELLGGNLEVVVDGRRHYNALTFGQFHHLDITYPAGSGYYHLVSGIDKAEYGIAYRLFGSV